MTLRYFIFITFSIWLCSCGTPTNENTKDLAVYLTEQFAMPVEENAIYCFVPANQCRNCMVYDAYRVLSGIDKKLVIISGFPKSNFRNFPNVYYDPQNRMLQLRMLNYGNRFVVCRHRQVEQVIVVTDFYRQLDSLAAAHAMP